MKQQRKSRREDTVRKRKAGWEVLLVMAISLMTSACHSSRTVFRNVDVRDLAHAGNVLGVDIEYKDDWALMLESSKWIGVPYRYAGNDRSGVDCSGLNAIIYNNVYGIKLQRRSADQFAKDCKKVRKSKLRTGDLVFFVTSDEKKKAENINHTGIFLKDGMFIHASTSRGVVVDDLNSKYFSDTWVTGGRVR